MKYDSSQPQIYTQVFNLSIYLALGLLLAVQPSNQKRKKLNGINFMII